MSGTNIETILGEVRQLSEKAEKGMLTPEQKTLLDGLNGKLDEIEEKNAENTQNWVKQQEQEAEFKQRIEDLEDQLINGQAGHSVDFKNSDAYKALTDVLVNDEKAAYWQEHDEKALLRTDSDVSGGVIATPEISSKLIEPITELNPIRQYADVMRIGSKSIIMPTVTGEFECEWEGEAEEGEEDAPSFGTEQITPFRLSVTVPVTLDQLMNSSFDVETWIMSKANQRFAKKEGTAFILGNGVKRPLGFISKKSIFDSAMNSSVAGKFDGDDLINLQGELKAGYNEMYTFNRRTLAYIRTLKGSDGQYLWQPGLNGAAVNQIAGTPYFLSPDMPNMANNAVPVAIADFKRGYQIVDRTDIAFVRDEVTRKKQAIVEVTVHKWVSGKPVLDEAFKLLKCKS